MIIIGDKKTCEYASTDMNRIVERYQTMQSGTVRDDTSEIAKLWTQLETQRREMEALTRELAAEKRQVEELRGSHMMALAGMEVAETNQFTALPSLKPAALPHPLLAAGTARPVPIHATPAVLQAPNLLQSVPLSQQLAQPQVSLPQVVPVHAAPPTMAQQAPVHQDDDAGNDSDMSEDTAGVDSFSEGTATDEQPALKRRRVEDADAIETRLPVQMPVNVPVSIPVSVPVAAAAAPVIVAPVPVSTGAPVIV